MKLSINSKIKLNNNVEMPIFGLGTWQTRGNDAINAVKWALEVGYIHIDTASLYGNEKKIGQTIKESKISREDIFITSKVWDSDQGFDRTLKALDISLKKLGTSYVDLYLIHWPRKQKRKETWTALEKIYKDEKARAIGVANYWIHHIKEITEKFEIIPAVNQFELSPFLYREDLVNFCRKNNITIEAYSPLTHGKKLNNLKLKKIAKKYNKSTAQILIRWGLQLGFVEIPKSTKKDHIIQNADVFDFQLSEEDMKVLNNIEDKFQLLFDTSKWD